MAWPVNKGSAFLRDPSFYRHDGFGHDNSQDPAGGKCFRTIPHSGNDLSGRGPVFSIAGGKVVRSGWSSMAGFYVIEEVAVPGFGIVYPVYFHLEALGHAIGDVKAGEQLGTIGDTGTGTSRGAFHLHLSVASSLKAATALVTFGNSPRRKNESVAQWAARMGLTDPLPLLRAVEHTKGSAPADVPASTGPTRDMIARRRTTMQMQFHGLYLVTFSNGAAKFYGDTEGDRQVYNALKTYAALYDYEKMESHPGTAWATATVLREYLWAASAVSTAEANDTIKALKAHIASLPKELDGDPAVMMLDTPTALSASS